MDFGKYRGMATYGQVLENDPGYIDGFGLVVDQPDAKLAKFLAWAQLERMKGKGKEGGGGGGGEDGGGGGGEEDNEVEVVEKS